MPFSVIGGALALLFLNNSLREVTPFLKSWGMIEVGDLGGLPKIRYTNLKPCKFSQDKFTPCEEIRKNWTGWSQNNAQVAL